MRVRSTPHIFDSLFTDSLIKSNFHSISGKYFASFEIPADFHGIWRYMSNMYQLDAFVQSSPADQDIINHYKLQIGGNMNSANNMSSKKHEELETPTYTTSIPPSVLVTATNNNHQ